MTTTTLTPDLRAIRRRLIRARLGTLEPHEADTHYAEDVAALLALLQDAREAATTARRAIRIEDRLSLR